jgi:hypothetical protein
VHKVFRFARSVAPPEINLSLLFLRHHGKWPNLKHPKAFSEKIQHRKLRDRNPLLPVLIDKILTKEYVGKKLGESWVTPTLWSGKKLPPWSERHRPGQKRQQAARTPKLRTACQGWERFFATWKTAPL